MTSLEPTPTPERQRIKHAVARCCAKPAYLRASVEGASRIALDGSPAGEVS
ncbi:ProQ/FINO family protein [Lamprobacter modestohalophilus]|uniref:ProQ/FINO family protein n=1 Tax=Lamprobacter modestohalophilus TaxID=1064514 RepID=UPI002ADED002|nr:ProQ/FINO family protein [Lamprobacter modestohalophilus]MEA1050564.1 ProQ/FINO family protein [Lamprobacter modestohalophilus]